MKRAVILGECQGGVVEASMPRPKEDWVLVKIHAAPLCTEYKTFTAGKKQHISVMRRRGKWLKSPNRDE